MESKLSGREARRELLEWIREAGRGQTELLQYVEDLEKKCTKYEEENASLKSEIARLKDAAARRMSSSPSMNSRLKDALRE